MATDFLTLFTEGGHANSLGRAGEVLEIVLSDKTRIQEVYDCIFDDDAWVRMRAIDTLEKVCRLHPEWVQPFLQGLLHDVSPIDQPSIQWHLAELFMQLNLSKDEQAKAIDIMKRNIASSNVDWIVAANTMKTLTDFVKRRYLSRSEITPLLTLQLTHRSNAVVKRAQKSLSELELFT